jgi:hypothetical protein
MNDNSTSPKIILPIPNYLYSGKHVIFRRRNNIVDITFECYEDVTTSTTTQVVDADGNPVTDADGNPVTTTTTTTNSIGYIVDKDSDISKTSIVLLSNMYVISFVCDGEKWYQIQ